MNIPDEAVEAAKTAIRRVEWSGGIYAEEAYKFAWAALESALPHLEAARAIDTVEGLRSIPMGALVMSSTRFFKTPKIYRRESIGFVDIEKRDAHVYAIGYFKDPLPVTVIWTPEERP